MHHHAERQPTKPPVYVNLVAAHLDPPLPDATMPASSRRCGSHPFASFPAAPGPIGTSEDVMDAAVLSRRRLFGRGLAGTALSAMAALGLDLRPAQARAWALRIAEAKQYASVCPYCAVGCDTLIFTKDGNIIDIEGDPNSPINQGTLCPKGAAIYQLHVNPNRLTQVLHRAPGASSWEVIDLEAAMDRVAELLKQTRDETFEETFTTTDAEGNPVEKIYMATTAIFSLGGATMDNEWNHLQQKLLRGLGVVPIENQARI
jgi:formate dehydrogenase major subunit